MTTRVGMITIGQSPRKDVVPEIKEILGKKIEVTECGALDGLSRDEVRRLAPTADDDVLVTRLQSGEEVIVGESRILVELQNCVDRLADECDLLALLCTGKFPQIKSKKIILMPEALLDGIVNGILGNITLGVLIPSERQRDQISKRWRHPDRKVVVESASPYSSHDEVTPSAQKLASSAPDFIVLDCMGFTSKTRETVRRLTARPVILPRSVLAHSILELIG